MVYTHLDKNKSSHQENMLPGNTPSKVLALNSNQHINQVQSVMTQCK